MMNCMLKNDKLYVKKDKDSNFFISKCQMHSLFEKRAMCD